MRKICGIYRIYNKKTGKSYVGQSQNIIFRKRAHYSNLRLHKHANIYLQRAYNKDGKGNICFEILEECPEEKLDEMEKFYIDKFDSMYNKNGYNLESGGCINKHHSEVSREKISRKAVGRKWTEERRKRYNEISRRLQVESFRKSYNKRNHPNYGKKFTLEERLRRSEAQGNHGDLPAALKLYCEDMCSYHEASKKSGIGTKLLCKVLAEYGLSRPAIDTRLKRRGY